MYVDVIINELESSVSAQVELAADDSSVGAAANALLTVLRPAIERAAMSLAEQAAQEVGAQLPDHDVDVVVRDGEPSIRVGQSRSEKAVKSGDFDARLTLRLPDDLKAVVEEAALEAGNSVNSYVVDLLNRRSHGRGRGRRYSGTIET